MCGIAGFFCVDRRYGEAGKQVLHKMASAIEHRGPDSDGYWISSDQMVFLGHRRLSILDLSPMGAQPMVSPSGRYVVTFNGEIYNWKELRSELEAHGWRFRGHSDTEVLLAAVEQWGLERAVHCFVGMFAFALWDSRDEILSLVRDRMGEKPLYYGWVGKSFAFASELKALRVHPEWDGTIDRQVLAAYVRAGYVRHPNSIYRGILSLLPGAILQICLRQSLCPAIPEPRLYWSVREAIERGLGRSENGDRQARIEELESLLRTAIKQQMVADVPVGAFLSGGVDSSVVVALMQQASTRPVKTFSIGFSETEFDEARHARAVAKHLGTDHTDLVVSPEEAQAVIPQLPRFFDEPLGDASQIPTFLVARLARRSVTVSLSGDGGDELFAGYRNYQRTLRIWPLLRYLPLEIRRTAGRVIKLIPPDVWRSIMSAGADYAWAREWRKCGGDRMHKFAEVLDFASLYELQSGTSFQTARGLVLGEVNIGSGRTERESFEISGRAGTLTKMCFHDLVNYLPGDILTKVDRAAMAVSLETRIPLLDHRVVEFACALPVQFKIRGGRGKWILRQVLYRYVPPELIDRPKQGFAVPIEDWLRGPLRGWAEALLDERRLNAEGFFNARVIREKWTEHLTGRRRWHALLWNVLMFQEWKAQTG